MRGCIQAMGLRPMVLDTQNRCLMLLGLHHVQMWDCPMVCGCRGVRGWCFRIYSCTGAQVVSKLEGERHLPAPPTSLSSSPDLAHLTGCIRQSAPSPPRPSTAASSSPPPLPGAGRCCLALLGPIHWWGVLGPSGVKELLEPGDLLGAEWGHLGSAHAAASCPPS